MIHKITYLSALGLILLLPFTITHLTVSEQEVKFLTTESQFEAGSTIILKFSNPNNSLPNLYCSNGYGSIIIYPILKDDILRYKIPKAISNKSGLVNWRLLTLDEELSGDFNIYSKQEVAAMETYLGPPSIEAGGADYSMLVVVPTDALDNPLKDGTQVLVKHQFLDSERIESVATNNLIAFKTIYSQSKTGRILIASECLEVNWP